MENSQYTTILERLVKIETSVSHFTSVVTHQEDRVRELEIFKYKIEGAITMAKWAMFSGIGSAIISVISALLSIYKR